MESLSTFYIFSTTTTTPSFCRCVIIFSMTAQVIWLRRQVYVCSTT